LGSYLEANGFIHIGHEPGMAADLMMLNENWMASPGLSIERVSNTESLKMWCQTCVKGFGMPSFVEDAFFDFMSHVGLGDTLPYIGLLNDQPVATSLMVLAAGVAGMYNVATVPEARQKGIGTWMTLTPLRNARAMGYHIGILHASEMGVNIYRRLGFREYCQIDHYEWSPAPVNEGLA
jgi:ribosomal protein S18 acetylase RimI-like enzyme